MKKIYLILLAILLFTLTLTIPFINAQKNEKIKILYIRSASAGNAKFLNGVSAYGETTVEHISKLKENTLDYLRQFDVFATCNSLGIGDVWGHCPEVVSKIGTLVEEGKSLIVLISNPHWSSPVSAWISARFIVTPTKWVDFEVVPCSLTQGVQKIKGSSVSVFLYGGYPLVLSPKRDGWPDPQGALAVYGYHGKGKYAVLSIDLFKKTQGDIGRLFSNIMYWLTNREIPPPPSVEQIYQSVRELNSTINLLYQRASDIERKLSKLDIGDINNDISSLKNSISKLNSQIDDLTNKLERTPNWLSYLSPLSMILSLIAIAIAIKKH